LRQSSTHYILDQEEYVSQVIQRFCKKDLPTKRTLLPSTFDVDLRDETRSDSILLNNEGTKLFQRIIGSINFLSTRTRPDISVAICKLSSRNVNPSLYCLNSAFHLLGYLKRTLDSHIRMSFYNKNNYEIIRGYSDASFAPTEDGRKSIGGFVIFVHGVPVDWRSIKLKLVVTSSCEAEYYIMSDHGREINFVRQLIEELTNKTLPATPIYCDNKAAIAIADNLKNGKRSRTFDIKYHHIKNRLLQYLTFIPIQFLFKSTLS